MSHRKPRRFFFGGTDTEVGKTYVTSLFAGYLTGIGHRTGVYKPVASGCERINGELVAEDAVSLWHAAGKPLTLETVCPQRFEKPLAPPQAASAEGKDVSIEQMIQGITPWEECSDTILIEGAGGLFSPIANDLLNIELAKQMDADLILVAENRLGSIHQVISTCVAAQSVGCEPLGIFLSHPKNDSHESLATNPQQIERYTTLPILGIIPHQGNANSVAGIKSIMV